MRLNEKQKACFLRQVDRSPHPDGCQIWIGWRNEHGSGRPRIDAVKQYAHRIMYSIAYDLDLNKGAQILHTCNNGHNGCVNPDHLYQRGVARRERASGL